MAASLYFHHLRVCKLVVELLKFQVFQSTCDEQNEQNTLFFTN
jgi:hypothetical protein